MKVKRPHAVKDAKRVALKSYSIWMIRLGFLSLVLPDLLYRFWRVDVVEPDTLFVVGLILYIAAEITRYVDQGLARSPLGVTVGAILIAMAQVPPAGEPPDAGAAGEVMPPYTQEQFLEVAVPHIARWEGLRTEAYQDIVGVWTVCYGETKGVQPGDSYTKAKCAAMLAEEIVDYQERWHDHLTPETLHARLTPERDTAFTSLAYNVGVRTAGTSTATKRLNAGNIRGGCEAIGWYTKAGNRVIRGLVLRREDDIALCMAGLT